MSVIINLTQCREPLELFGGEDTEMSIEYIEDGHAGPGLYAWPTEYPDEGSMLLGESDVPTPRVSQEAVDDLMVSDGVNASDAAALIGEDQ